MAAPVKALRPSRPASPPMAAPVAAPRRTLSPVVSQAEKANAVRSASEVAGMNFFMAAGVICGIGRETSGGCSVKLCPKERAHNERNLFQPTERVALGKNLEPVPLHPLEQ